MLQDLQTSRLSLVSAREAVSVSAGEGLGSCLSLER